MFGTYFTRSCRSGRDFLWAQNIHHVVLKIDHYTTDAKKLEDPEGETFGSLLRQLKSLKSLTICWALYGRPQ